MNDLNEREREEDETDPPEYRRVCCIYHADAALFELSSGDIF